MFYLFYNLDQNYNFAFEIFKIKIWISSFTDFSFRIENFFLTVSFYPIFANRNSFVERKLSQITSS